VRPRSGSAANGGGGGVRPEATWLTVDSVAALFVAALLGRSLAASRGHGDRRTRLPFYGYSADLERLFERFHGSRSDRRGVHRPHGFGAFNNAFGMAKGDDVLRSFAQALAHFRHRWPSTAAMSSSCSAPPAGPAARMAAFRETWAAEFATTYGHGVVAPRVPDGDDDGDQIVATP
jgi:hypothetical protein